MEYLGRMRFSWITKKKLAYIGAGGVPIAVPVICNQNVPQNWNTLFSMTIERASVRVEAGILTNFISL